MNYVDAPIEADFAMTVRGDGMEPEYMDGDIVYILWREEVRDGEVAVVVVEDEAMLKRVYKQDGGAVLTSNKCSPIRINGELQILGIPCGFTRIFKEE